MLVGPAFVQRRTIGVLIAAANTLPAATQDRQLGSHAGSNWITLRHFRRSAELSPGDPYAGTAGLIEKTLKNL